MQISQNVSLRKRNSFGFDISAEYFCEPGSLEDIAEALEWRTKHQTPLFILGGGSNTLFTRNVDGLVMHIAINHLNSEPASTPPTSNQTNNTITVSAGAGVNWHELVKTTIANNQYGLENLALIPGDVGAAPIQNIGAYGKELCDNLISVDTIDRYSGELITLSNTECEFSYRHSLFKTTAGKHLIVTGIKLALSSVDNPHIGYQALKNCFTDSVPDARSVFDHVCRIRNEKLPNPSVIGNAGSFFKNPVLPRQQVDTLKQKYADLPVYPHSDSHRKLPAAWLIERAGWKGHRQGEVGVHDRQALVLVNHGAGNGQQIAILADEIQQDIKARYNIALEREPVLY